MTEQTKKCPICGEPYKVYPNYSGDQSACADCQYRAEKEKKCDEFIDFVRRNQ